jgi:hypothetical protein
MKRKLEEERCLDQFHKTMASICCTREYVVPAELPLTLRNCNLPSLPALKISIDQASVMLDGGGTLP